MTSYSSP